MIMKAQQKIGSAGRKGESIRSDCFVQITIKSSGGISIDLKSKVESLYGSSIRSHVKEILHNFSVAHAEVVVEDQGAVPFVMAARVEAALLRANNQLNAPHIPGKVANTLAVVKDRPRRTRLYLPGNEPHFFLNAALHMPDGIILDLEDSVAPAEKHAARLLVRNALTNVQFGGCERMVRINPSSTGLDDLRYVIPYSVQTILVPKCESASTVQQIDREIDAIMHQHSLKRNTLLIPIIESALGVVNAFEIASASKWNCALAIGLEDYTADIGVERTKEGRESLFARSAVINAAKAAGIHALDSVFSDVNDEEGLRQNVLEAKALGFEGKGCIHPRQIGVVHEAFAPTEKEIEYAHRVIDAYTEAKRSGSGVVSLGSKMIDAPVVKRANRIIALTKKKNSIS
jgi:citrate lyase subunit beta/citryl-CoA lyase